MMKAQRVQRKDSTTKAKASSRLARTPARTQTSRLAKTTQRFAKQTLRQILLSKMFQATAKVLIVGLFAGGVGVIGYKLIDTTFANEVVISKSEIIRSVSKHVVVPEEEPEAVVRVQDAETLKQQNVFYTDVKIGDYILVYRHMAIIYDLRNDVIVAMRQTKQ